MQADAMAAALAAASNGVQTRLNRQARAQEEARAPPCPPACLFPVGCVLLQDTRVLPVLDPECACPCACNLRALDSTHWSAFLQKANCVLAECNRNSGMQKPVSILVVSEADLIELAKGTRDAHGHVEWEDLHSLL